MRYQINLPRKDKGTLSILSTTLYIFDRFRPIHFFTGKNVREEDVLIQIEALRDVLSIAKVQDILPIRFFGYDGEHGRIERYLNQAFNPRRRQYDAMRLIDLLNSEPSQEELPRYVLLVLRDEDLYSENYNFLIGASSFPVSVVSLRRYQNCGREIRKQAGIHEYGHNFLGLEHCSNLCSMRFPNIIPFDLDLHAKDRIKSGRAFCSTCEKEGYNSFWKKLEQFLHYVPELYEIYDGLRSKEPEVIEKVASGELAKMKIVINYV